MSKKLYNPKSNAPSVFIPAWLIQISSKLLSCGAKMLYGRLAQWSNTKGQVHRSASKLAKELGENERQIKRFLKELRDNELIDTHQIQLGGENYFIFYDHPWMHETIIKELCYTDNIPSEGCDNLSQGGGQIVTGGGTNTAHRNKKEIREIKRPFIQVQKTHNESVKIKPNNWKESIFDTAFKEEDDMAIEEQPSNEPFERFWNAYPAKQNKPRTKALWQQEGLDNKIDEILTKLQQQVKSDAQWKKGYIPSSSNYITGHQWLNNISKPISKTGNYTNGKPSYHDNESTDWIFKMGGVI